jgi:glycosyltransferase involved in cell wall biosynthesis
VKHSPKITIFTPTYNRGYILGKLYASIIKQTYDDFEWLVVDDGSNDNTKELFKKWENEGVIDIKYVKTQNEGKPRAINRALQIARGKFFVMIDSDDYFTPDALEKINLWVDEINELDDFIGVSGARGTADLNYLKYSPLIDPEIGYVDATELDRYKFRLDADMTETYKTDILRKFVFHVWAGEKFAPEEITTEEIALAGYKLRWYKDIICICEYRNDGLTKGSWNLEKNNPMGYAMLYNHKLKILKGMRKRIHAASQHIALSIIGNNISYIFKSNDILLTILCLPLGFMLSIRRKLQHLAK